jgi:hypothetical protein
LANWLVGFGRKVVSIGSWGRKMGREEQGKWKDVKSKKKGGKAGKLERKARKLGRCKEMGRKESW